MNTLIIEWTCGLCKALETTTQAIPEGYDEIPDWVVLQTPNGWAHDLEGDKEYCPKCWEEVYELWIEGLDYDN